MADEYRRFLVTSSAAVERECLLAEAFEAGAAGAEEIDAPEGFQACVYGRADQIEGIRQVLTTSAAEGTEIGHIEPLPEVDWSEAWKKGLDAIVVSERLVIRPPFVERTLEPGQREIVIDPGQAFGIGGHASTRLCLEWIDELVGQGDSRELFDRVLDVGTGSGVLALAAVALGAKSAVGFDLDPVATEAAREAAILNHLTAEVHFFTGPIEALHQSTSTASLVLANLLKQEMLPIAAQIAACVRPGGRLVLAGLLEEDVAEVKVRFAETGLREVGRRERDDSTGRWTGLCLAFADSPHD